VVHVEQDRARRQSAGELRVGAGPRGEERDPGGGVGRLVDDAGDRADGQPREHEGVNDEKRRECGRSRRGRKVSPVEHWGRIV
jgi:hypothetical protein